MDRAWAFLGFDEAGNRLADLPEPDAATIARLRAKCTAALLSRDACRHSLALRERELADAKNANAALQQSSAIKDRQLEEARAELAAQASDKDALIADLKATIADLQQRLFLATAATAKQAHIIRMHDAELQAARAQPDKREPDAARPTPELAGMADALDAAQGALVGLAYRLGELECDRLAQRRRDAARRTHHPV